MPPIRTVICLLFVGTIGVLSADTRTIGWQDPNNWHLTNAFPAALVQRNSASIVPQSVGQVLHALHPIKSTGMGKSCPAADVSTPPQLDWREGDTFILHVAGWGRPQRDATAPAGSNNASIQIANQNWYVYQANHDSDEDITIRKRIFGARRMWLVYLHFNIDTAGGLAYDVAYDAAVKSKTPAYLNHLTDLLGLFQGAADAMGGAPPVADLTTRWGAHCFTADSIPSDVTFTPRYSLLANTPVPPAALNYGSVGTALAGATAETFDNEGLYRFDFSVGVPLKKIRDVQYVSASGMLAPADVGQQNIFALVNYYFQPVDIKRSGFSWVPHAVAGVKIGSQPLKRAIVGVGYGPALANLYFGLVLNSTNVPAGTACGATLGQIPDGAKLKRRTCAEFGWGLNISVGAAVDAMKKKQGGN